jgi:hypothetical protein
VKAIAMARPRKQEFERRSATVRADVTIAEKAFVQEQVMLAGLTEAEYVRRRVLGIAIPPRSEKQAKAAFVSEINRLGSQLAGLGNLANQVALYCHTGRTVPASWDSLPNEIKALLRLVEQTLEKVIYDHGPEDP